MVKRLFWIGLGTMLGVLIAAKAQAYVRERTPDGARQFLLGSDQENVHIRTLQGLVRDFNTARLRREHELGERYVANRS